VTRALSLLLALACTCALAADERRAKGSPLYGAIAYHAASNNAGWATDRKSSREARLEALKQCGHEECVVVGTVTRGCLALARGAKKTVTQKGTTQQEAQTKALSRCGAGCEIAAWTCTR
jgi:hypothetical protein